MALFNWRKSYCIQVRCINCNQTQTLKIPKGSIIEDHMRISICENCGCNRLRRIEPAPLEPPKHIIRHPIVQPKQYLEVPRTNMDFNVPRPDMRLGIPQKPTRFFREEPRPKPRSQTTEYYEEPQQEFDDDDDVNDPKWTDS